MHQVTEILFDNSTTTSNSSLVATGVKALNRSNNDTLVFSASKEVILAAGGVFTPQLLQWSGIGPRDVLEAAGIETKIDFPAVGSNFQDHPVAYISFTGELPPLIKPSRPPMTGGKRSLTSHNK